MSFEIFEGDCIERMAEMEEASVDAVICDPPAGIAFMGKSWDHDRGGRDRWIEWLAEAMSAALRICKPGAHAFVWALPRTSHWTAFALEDAGWEIRDRIAHHFGSGFPKNKDLGEGVGTALKPATEDWWLARKPFSGSTTACFLEHGTGGINVDGCRLEGAPPSVPQPNLKNGDALNRLDPSLQGRNGEMSKAAGRWPANVVLSHLEECEAVGTKVVKPSNGSGKASAKSAGLSGVFGAGSEEDMSGGLGGSEVVEVWNCARGCPVAELDAQSGVLQSGLIRAGSQREGIGYHGGLGNTVAADSYGDSGGASRFFYCSKTSRAERNAGLEGFEEKQIRRLSGGDFDHNSAVGADGQTYETASSKAGGPSRNHHPTVKPINLMRWLVRLITPPGGTCLDPFLGSGSTGAAAVLEGFDFIGIEREAEYIAIAEARIAFWAQHEGREVEDVLGLRSVSQKQAKALADVGQLSIEEAAA